MPYFTLTNFNPIKCLFCIHYKDYGQRQTSVEKYANACIGVHTSDLTQLTEEDTRAHYLLHWIAHVKLLICSKYVLTHCSHLCLIKEVVKLYMVGLSN